MSTRPGMYQLGNPSRLSNQDQWLPRDEALQLAERLHRERGELVAVWSDKGEFVAMWCGGQCLGRV